LDTPGFTGRLGTALGEAGTNVATFNLSRREALGEAVALVAVDGDVPTEVVAKLAKLEGVREVEPLRF
jgi:D-3-phosphoglycerate dehydrogenase